MLAAAPFERIDGKAPRKFETGRGPLFLLAINYASPPFWRN